MLRSQNDSGEKALQEKLAYLLSMSHLSYLWEKVLAPSIFPPSQHLGQLATTLVHSGIHALNATCLVLKLRCAILSDFLVCIVVVIEPFDLSWTQESVVAGAVQKPLQSWLLSW